MNNTNLVDVLEEHIRECTKRMLYAAELKDYNSAIVFRDIAHELRHCSPEKVSANMSYSEYLCWRFDSKTGYLFKDL